MNDYFENQRIQFILKDKKTNKMDRSQLLNERI